MQGPHTVDLPKSAGCATVGTGIEAASDRIHYELLKRRITQSKDSMTGVSLAVWSWTGNWEKGVNRCSRRTASDACGFD